MGVGGGMKLLLDANLSRRLVPALEAEFPGTSQVALLGMDAANDRAIWQYAREHGFVLVTKDDDFTDLQTLYGYPPKLIVMRMGNCSNQQVRDALLNAAPRLQELLRQDAVGMVELG